MDYGAVLLKRLQGQFLSMGPSGIKHMAKTFEFLDSDGNHSVSKEEFKKNIQHLDIELSDNDVEELFRLFDKDGSGAIAIDEFTKALEPTLSEKRKETLEKVFKYLDKTGDGVITVEDMVKARKGPEFQTKEFLERFEADDHKDGKVTKDEFMSYYKCMGVSIDDDDAFNAMIASDWQID